ncbi:MAG: ribonuclease Z [Candidatus Micrarchaeota archaeon]|nr:ribonuclease Z [Candidatus Micrarchaeota archaeon]
MFEITVLGSSSGAPSLHRNLPSVAVRYEGELLLLDCGEGTQRQMMRFGISFMKLKAIFISHLHLDHYLGVFGIAETMRLNKRTEPLAVYGPPGIAARIGRGTLAKPVEFSGNGVLADFGKFQVSSFKVQHSKESFGFLIEEKEKRRFYEEKAKRAGLRGEMFSQIMREGSLRVGRKVVRLEDITYVQPGRKIVYSGDAAPCAETIKAAEGADLLIHEATFSHQHSQEAAEAAHSTARQAAEIAKKAGCKKLLLTHISGRYADASELLAQAKEVFKDTLIAEDGLRLSI